MKKRLILPLWLLAIPICAFLFSCQKDADSTIPEQPTISSKDPQAVSAAVSVWHGLRVAGEVPKSTASADLKLGKPEQEAVTAIAGRYAFIQPKIESGNVAGYYVRISSANEYFNVDYTKPVKVSKVNPGSQPSGISTAGIINHGSAKGTTKKPRSPFTLLGDDDGFNDSLIVINLPPNIKTPDTLCVTYWAYDFDKHISNPVTTCIYISHLGGDNDSKWLEGNWVPETDVMYENGQLLETYNYAFNKWIPDMEFNIRKYYRRGDTLIEVNHNNANYYTYYDIVTNPPYRYYNNTERHDKYFVKQATDILLGSDSILIKKNFLKCQSNGMLTGEYLDTCKYVTPFNSVDKLEFSGTGWTNHITKGAWSYDAITKKLTIVYESIFNPDSSVLSTINTEVNIFSVEKISNDKWKATYPEEIDGKKYTFISTIKRQ